MTIPAMTLAPYLRVLAVGRVDSDPSTPVWIHMPCPTKQGRFLFIKTISHRNILHSSAVLKINTIGIPDIKGSIMSLRWTSFHQEVAQFEALSVAVVASERVSDICP